MDLNRIIDHTDLKPDATRADIERLCDEALEHGFYSVCVNSSWTSMCAARLAGTGVRVATCVGFPLGAMSTTAKAFEAERAVADGTDELDMVIPVGRLVSGEDDAVREDVAAVVRGAQGHPVKTILECCLLTPDQIVRGCELCASAGAAFVKTSTGFSRGGATLDDVRLMRKTVGDACGVKAAGGIHTRSEALAFVEAGATRLGTSSGIVIARGAQE
jgi:deoxyribose-phosphate aldolase